MKKFAFALLAMATALAIAPAALADSISGSIAIGEASNSSDTWSATGITFLGTGAVHQATGTLSGLLNDSATLTSFTFDPASSAVGVELFNVGSGLSTFTIDSVAVNFNSGSGGSDGSFLNLVGTGLLTETGYDNTLATFSLTSTTTGTTSFTVDATTISATPEPSSLILLGTGLLGLAMVVFWKNKPSGLVLHS